MQKYQRIFEKTILILVLAALVLAVFGLIFSDNAVSYAGIIVLMLVAVAYAVMQIIIYLTNKNKEESRSLMLLAIITTLVALLVVCAGILVMTGKLFPNGVFSSVWTGKFIR